MKQKPNVASKEIVLAAQAALVLLTANVVEAAPKTAASQAQNAPALLGAVACPVLAARLAALVEMLVNVATNASVLQAAAAPSVASHAALLERTVAAAETHATVVLIASVPQRLRAVKQTPASVARTANVVRNASVVLRKSRIS